jgi:hypothetical protein
MTKMPAHNERFGATAAGSADLKSSAEMPPLLPSRLPVGCKARKRRSQLESELKKMNNPLNILKKNFFYSKISCNFASK